MIVAADLERDVIASRDDYYRWWLSRQTGITGHGFGLDMIVWLMLNPSKARGEGVGDPTQGRVHTFSSREGTKRYGIWNLFAKSTPYPDKLFTFGYEDAVGDQNDHVLDLLLHARTPRWRFVAAWGKPSKLRRSELELVRDRIVAVHQTLLRADVPLYHLATTADGWVRHPLMLAADTPMTAL